jgi:class 3 adenylate cyclase/tetratricopeptide (TPR) repeat protein
MAVCPKCGEDNPDKAKFCLECATPLATRKVEVTEERKIVSVLFVDLVDFTARSHAADPEDVRAALQPYHALLKREIERFGGTVEKFIGDAVMAVFGAPIAHEDDAERAVRAALRIIDAIEELNQDASNLELSIRAAVNTGEGLVNVSAQPQAGEGMVTGDVVNTASRLQGIAPVNGVAVGELTYRSSRNVFEYEAMEPVSLKGKPEPVPIYQALRPTSRMGYEAEATHATPFIGRELDLGILRQTYQRMLREDSTQLVTITGEPGVGKSRLLAEMFSFVDDGPDIVFWRQGRCLPYGEGITFWALGEIIKAHAGILESDSAKEASDKLTAAVDAVLQDDSQRSWVTSRLAPLVGARTEATRASKEESFTAWRRFLEAVAETRPLILVFEDLHWADPSLLGFIEHFVDWSSGVPVLVVCTARPELQERHPGWGGGFKNSTTVSLSPLTDTETAQLISALLSQAVLPAEMHTALLERAGGNPLYAEEFVRMLSDRGILRATGRALDIDQDADIVLPDNVQALIAARLDTLAPERKSLLHDASVVGKVFWAEALAALAEGDEGDVRQGLHELTRKELVRPARTSSLVGSEEYSFWHALIRDVSYSHIPRAQRLAKHKAVAAWIESVAGERVADHAEVLAHHYEEALDLARRSGAHQAVGVLEAQSRKFLVMGAERARHLDMQRAYDLYLRALELLPPEDSTRAKVLFEAAKIASGMGATDEAEAQYREVLALSREAGDLSLQGQVLDWLAQLLQNQGRILETEAFAVEAIELLEQVPPSPALCHARYTLSYIRWEEGSFSEALDLADQAHDLAQKLSDKHSISLALDARSIARMDLGDVHGHDDARRALHFALEVGNPFLVCAQYNNLASATWWIEGPVEALALYEKAIQLGEERGVLWIAFHARAESVWSLFDLGRWEEVLAEAERITEWGSRHGDRHFEAIAAPYKAWIASLRGQGQEAKMLEPLFLELAREIGGLQVMVPALAIAAAINMAVGEGFAAERLIGELEKTTDGRPNWRARYITAVVRVLVSLSQLEHAEQLLETVSDVPFTRDRYSVLAARAIVAESRNEHERAVVFYKDAATKWESYGHVLEQAHALFGAARCLVALDRRPEALTMLEEARTLFGSLGAGPLVTEVEGYLMEPEALRSK